MLAQYKTIPRYFARIAKIIWKELDKTIPLLFSFAAKPQIRLYMRQRVILTAVQDVKADTCPPSLLSTSWATCTWNVTVLLNDGAHETSLFQTEERHVLFSLQLGSSLLQWNWCVIPSYSSFLSGGEREGIYSRKRLKWENTCRTDWTLKGALCWLKLLYMSIYYYQTDRQTDR